MIGDYLDDLIMEIGGPNWLNEYSTSYASYKYY